MRKIKEIKKNELKEVLRLASKSFPSIGITSEQKVEEFEAMILKDYDESNRKWYALYEDKKIIGSMVLYDFCINYYQRRIEALGIGFVAVDLLNKKQKVCKEMLEWYLKHTEKNKKEMAMLFSFRPDFYKKMGFGFGTNCYNYKYTPDSFPKISHPLSFKYLNIDHYDEVQELFDGTFEHTHGYISRRAGEIKQALKSEQHIKIGFYNDAQLEAYLLFHFEVDKSNHENTDMHVQLFYKSSAGLKSALHFINTQSDQVRYVYIYNQDSSFYYNMSDIRHRDLKVLQEPGYHFISEMGMGIMYKSVDHTSLLLKKECQLDKLAIKFNIEDSFAKPHSKSFIIEWKNKKAFISQNAHFDIELTMNVSDFSSWLMNSIDLTTLHRYGLLECNHAEELTSLDRAFYYGQKPVCNTRF